jgi:hypothetical protein
MPGLNSFFRWKNCSYLIALFWPMGWAMVGIAISIEPAGVWFILAYAFNIVAVLCGLGAWLTSEFLQYRSPKAWNQKRRKHVVKNQWVAFYVLKWGGTLAILIFLAINLWGIRGIQVQYELKQPYGRLSPANDPTPVIPCGQLGIGDVAIFLGTNVGIAKQFPYVVVRLNNQDRLVLNREPDGTIGLSVDIRSDDGKIIARLMNGKFEINEHNTLNRVHTDQSTLEVVDQYGDNVLHVRYLNPHAISLQAILRYSELKGPLRIQGDGIYFQYHGSGSYDTISHSCFRGGPIINLTTP